MATTQGKAAVNPLRLLGMFIPLVYFGGMIYYFSQVGGGTIQGIVDIGLGPTVAGLTIVGLLFCIQPAIMLIRLAIPSPAPRTVGHSAADEPLTSGGFDADDAVARYLAKRAAGPELVPELAHDRGRETGPSEAPPAPRPAFGRKSS